MPHNIRLFSDVGAKMSMFDNKAKRHKENQMINPFSDWDGSGTRRKLSRDDPDYGKPVAGSKTAERGRQAQLQMIADMVELCDLIFDCGMRSPDGRGAICFGDVFRLYSQINDKCVGLLMRGRKHNILDFEGEMLFQRRDDHKMIELLLPLNTIRHKYGMPERAGCGEVRLDLLEEMEHQQREKQPARSRSMEQLGLPPPQMHKSRSMELRRQSEGADEGWQLTADGDSNRRGSSTENLTQIVEDDGDAGLLFTAVPQGAVGGAADAGDAAGGINKSDGERSDRENESAAGEPLVKWEIGSDDTTNEIQVEDSQENSSTVAQLTWPEIKIVVEDDADQGADTTDKKCDADEVEAENKVSVEKDNEGEKQHQKADELHEQGSLIPDCASLAPESEPEFDFWASTEQDPWTNEDDSVKSGRNSAMQTPPSKTPDRISSPSLAEANPTVEQTEVGDEVNSRAESASPKATSKCENRQTELSDTSVASETGEEKTGEEKTFSFWDVTDEHDTSGDVKSRPTSSSSENVKPHDVDKDQDNNSFSFWDVAEDIEVIEKVTKDRETYNVSDGEELGCSSLSTTNHPEKEPSKIVSNVQNHEEQEAVKTKESDVNEEKTDNRPATNGETLSFWNVSDEDDADQIAAFPRSKTYFWNDDDTPKTPPTLETKTSSPDDPGGVDGSCHERLLSQADGQWDASSAEHPASGDHSEDHAQPSPPHMAVSGDSELMPAR